MDLHYSLMTDKIMLSIVWVNQSLPVYSNHDICMLGKMSHVDSLVPDQPAHPYSLI